ncbi:MAG: STAS-like domain-containing protein [Patescibacteria group bacterium]
MKTISLASLVGSFAENKDVARDIRLKDILPIVSKGKEIIIDFDGINGATQSFIHALISDVIRQEGVEVIEKLHFKNCNLTVRRIISIVIDYMQESF